MKVTPYVCSVCPGEDIETEDGNTRGYYGVLVRDGKPMVGNGEDRALVCPNDGSQLVPARQGQR